MVPAASAPVAAPPAAFDIADDTIMTGKDFKQSLQQAFTQYVQPGMQRTNENSASAVLGVARTIHADAFGRYGDEIQRELARVPKEHWTLDNLDTVVTLVKGRHVDEYAREAAQHLASQMEPTIRSGSGGSGPTPTPSVAANPFEAESVPAEWKQRAKAANIDERTIREFCAANDMTPEMFWKQFERSAMQPIVAEASVRG